MKATFEGCTFLQTETVDAAELAALRKNAERYRKLRAQNHSMSPRISVPFEPGKTYKPDGLDAALDALPDDCAG